MTDDRRPPMMGSLPIPFGAPRPKPSAIDESAEISRQLERDLERQQALSSQLTYRSCVAESINECRYLDVKNIAKEIVGDPPKPIETAADLADRMAEWAAENKTRGLQP